MRKLWLIVGAITLSLFVSAYAERTKLLDSRIKVTEKDTDKKKLLLVADLPPAHGTGSLELEVRVSKNGPNVVYSVQLDGVERIYSGISRETTADRVRIPLKYEDEQLQIYFWYASGIGVCEARIIVYISEEAGTRPSTGSWGDTGTPPEGYKPPQVEDDKGPGTVSPGEDEGPGTVPPPGSEKKAPTGESTVKPEVKIETKTETKPTVKPEVKIEPKPGVKAETKPETKTETKPEVKVETKPETKTSTKPAPEVTSEEEDEGPGAVPPPEDMQAPGSE